MLGGGDNAEHRGRHRLAAAPGDAVKQSIMRLDPDQKRQRHAGLHDDVDPALHELVHKLVDRREHALDILLAEFAEADRNHDQHHAGRRDAIELIGRVVDDGERLEHADLHLGHELLEHHIFLRTNTFW